MQHFRINKFGKIKINSFRPLCSTPFGIRAIETHGLPPFIDGSCRREPDFQNPFPAITSLCRQGVLAPTLKKGDIVVYTTVGGRQLPYKYGHHLVAILQVDEIFETHKDGADSYRNSDILISNNCMIDLNPPIDFSMTFGNFENLSNYRNYLNMDTEEQEFVAKNWIYEWNNSYKWKSEVWPKFVKTNPIYINLQNPIFLDDKIGEIFSVFPNTRSPKLITIDQLSKLAELVDTIIEY